jgi:hypothetical protein
MSDSSLAGTSAAATSDISTFVAEKGDNNKAGIKSIFIAFINLFIIYSK